MEPYYIKIEQESINLYTCTPVFTSSWFQCSEIDSSVRVGLR